MKKYYVEIGVAIIVFVLLGFFLFYKNNNKSDSPIITQIDFSKTGIFVMNNPGMEENVPYLIYDEPGKPAVTTKLKFDTDSKCIVETNTLPCLAMSTSFDVAFGGKKVSITGVYNEDKSVVIKRLSVVQNVDTKDIGGGSILPYDSGVEGVVTIGPTCPVMREGDTSCSDKPYLTSIQIIQIGSPKSSPFATVQTDKNGKYKIMLPPGDYALQPVGGPVLPRCETQEVTLVPAKIIKMDLYCDTGIR